jgi:hypothetical protein
MNRINIPSKLSFIISSTTLEHKITEELKNKKETLTKKVIYLLQILAGIKKP